MDNDKDRIRQALQKLSFLVVQDIRMTETARAGSCGSAIDAFRGERGNLHQPKRAGAETECRDNRSGRRDAGL